MTDWTTIPISTFDTDQPVLGSTHLADYQNIFALTEGSVDAPKIASAALALTIDTGSAATGVVATILDLDRVSQVLAICSVRATAGGSGSRSSTLGYQTSTNNGASWSATTNVVTTTASGDGVVRAESVSVVIDVTAANAFRLIASQTGSTGSSTSTGTCVAINGITP